MKIEDLAKMMNERFDSIEARIEKLEKKSTTSSTTKSTSTKSKKSGNGKKSKTSDDFDRDTYLSVAETLGCKGKHGVWKGCREFYSYFS